MAAVLLVEQLHALDTLLVDDQAFHLVIVEGLGAVQTGVEQVGNGQAEGVDRSVGNAYGADQVWVDGGLDAACLGRVDDVGADAGSLAGLDKGLLVLQVILGQGDEQAVGLLDAVTGNAPQDHVLADALAGALAVGHGISGTTVHQAVVAARGAGAVVVALHEQHAQTAQGAISRGSGTRGAATNDDHVVFFFINFVCYHKLNIRGSRTNRVIKFRCKVTYRF